MRKHLQYMALCVEASKIFSTCAKKKYASVLVDDFGHVVGLGYNGGPKGHVHCVDGGCPRYNQDSPSGSIYDNCIAIHAEANALLHSDYSSRPKILYVNGPPCFSCAKLIVNSTVDQVVCVTDTGYNNWPSVRRFLEEAGVSVMEIKDASV